MSIINNGLLLASGADAAVGYQISRSLRFNGTADSTYLNRTFSLGNRRTWTWSGWVKRSTLSSGFQTLFSGGSGGGRLLFGFGSNDTFSFELQGTGSHATTAVFRDPSAWYHVVVAFDTTQATAADRTKVWINNTLQTLSGLTFSQNADYAINSNVDHRIGCQTSSVADFFNGYLADIYLLDGTATTPSTFAETDAVTGQWVPKTPTGISYGTNGFRLSLSDNSGTTSTTLGKDAAGSNNWTPNNFSVASGSGNDSLVDSPTSFGTDTGAGGEVRGNYATWTPLVQPYGGISLTNGNLENTGGGSVAVSTIGIPPSGKYYVEVSGTGCTGGVCPLPRTTQIEYNLGAGVTGVIGIAVNRDAGEVKLYKDNVLQSTTTFSSAGISADATLFIQSFSGSPYSAPAVLNAGQRPFAYTAPSGFKALCDQNLPAPTIARPSTVFDAILWTGTGTSQTVTGLSFSPDLLWIKKRNNADNHSIFDSVRGTGKYISSNLTNAEAIDNNSLTAFNSNGFSSGGSVIGDNNNVYITWAWDAGSSTVTNTQGSITTSVRASASSGFAVITGSTPSSNVNFSFGHNLGIAPSLVIYKHTAVSGNWQVYHRNGGGNNYNLNSTAGPANSGTWSGLDPTSTLITIPSTIISANSSAFVCYAWAPVAGYSAMSSFVGNGSSDGVFQWCGFRPRFVVLKSATSATNWFVHDSARSSYNAARELLFPNLSNAEDSSNNYIDLLSNGFKLRFTNTDYNTSGQTYIWAAWAESPFAYSRAR